MDRKKIAGAIRTSAGGKGVDEKGRKTAAETLSRKDMPAGPILEPKLSDFPSAKAPHRDGESDHRDLTGESWPGMGMIMTLEIEKQNGSAFHGKWCSQHECEDVVVGVIKSNGEIRMADHDGHFEASMIRDRMEVCYIEAGGEHRIAVCRFMEKE